MGEISNSANLLIIGAGSIGRKHEANARKLGVNTRTVDSEPSARADFLDPLSAFRHYGPDHFTHAIIATPLKSHLSILTLLLDQRIPRILVEKPLAYIDEADNAEKMYRTFSYSQKVFLGFNWRFHSSIIRMKEIIASGEIGHIQVAQLSAREWLPKYGGQVLLESGSHILDTLRYLLGEVKVLGANLANHGRLGKSDESACILLRTEQNSSVYVHVNFVNVDAYDYRVLVQGSKGTRECRPDRSEEMHLGELKAFLQDDETVLATFEDGLRNLKLLRDVVGK